MINNPGAIAGPSILLPLKQRVSAAEPDNSNTCKDAFGGLNHQHLTTFNTGMTNVSIVFLFHLALLTFRSSQLPAMRLSPSSPLLNLKKFILTSALHMFLKVSSGQDFLRWSSLFARILRVLLWFYFFSVQGGAGVVVVGISTIGLGIPRLRFQSQSSELAADLYIF